jgi:hypothetical protein
MTYRMASASFLFALVTTSTAMASPQGKTPFWQAPYRETELIMERWDQPVVLERTRSFGRKRAIFYADPQPIPEAAVYVFEAVAAGEDQPRWRCVAVDDVAECLGAPVRVEYQRPKETVRLTIRAVPKDTERGRALVQEASWHGVDSFARR